jgi:hypothetical protein
MRKLPALGILALALVAIPARTETVVLSDMPGSRLIETCSVVSTVTAGYNICTGYTAAVTDSLVLGKEICRPTGVTGNQIIAIIRKHLEANPDRWHLHGYTLIREALKGAFPCEAGRIR